MWFLEFHGQNTAAFDRKQVWLPPSRSHYTVGRKNTNIVLAAHSVSNKHAQLKIVQSSNSRQQLRSQLVLIDTGSTQGTIIRSRDGKCGSMTETNAHQFTEYSLSDGDQVEFAHNSFTVGWKPLGICCTGLAAQQRAFIQANAKNCDYTVHSQWNKECTHLITSDVRSSIKTIAALQAGGFIVGMNWLEKYINYAIAVGKLGDDDTLPEFSIPDPSKYLPPIAENSFGLEKLSWQPDQRRQRVFHNCQFCLFGVKKDFPQLVEVVEQSSGQCVFIADQTLGARVVKKLKSLRNQSVYFMEPVPDYALEYLAQLPKVYMISESSVYEAVVKLQLPHELNHAYDIKVDGTEKRANFIQKASIQSISSIPGEAAPQTITIDNNENPFSFRRRPKYALKYDGEETKINNHDDKEEEEEEEANPFSLKRISKATLGGGAVKASSISPCRNYDNNIEDDGCVKDQDNPFALKRKPKPFVAKSSLNLSRSPGIDDGDDIRDDRYRELSGEIDENLDSNPFASKRKPSNRKKRPAAFAENSNSPLKRVKQPPAIDIESPPPQNHVEYSAETDETDNNAVRENRLPAAREKKWLRCPADKPNLPGKTIVEFRTDLAIKKPSGQIINTKTFEKVRPVKSGIYTTIVGVEDMVLDNYSYAGGSIDPWLFEKKQHSTKRRV